MDVFVLSSRAEGMPNVVLEAMAMGVPCVVTVATDAERLLASCGVTVPVADPTGLAHGIKRVLSAGATERERMAQCGRRRVRESYSLDSCVDRFEALYEDLVGRDLS